MPVNGLLQKTVETVGESAGVWAKEGKAQITGSEEKKAKAKLEERKATESVVRGIYEPQENFSENQLQDIAQKDNAEKLIKTNQFSQELRGMQGKKTETTPQRQVQNPISSEVDMKHFTRAQGLGHIPLEQIQEARDRGKAQEEGGKTEAERKALEIQNQEIVVPGKSSGRKRNTRSRMQPRRTKLKSAETRGGSGNRE